MLTQTNCIIVLVKIKKEVVIALYTARAYLPATEGVFKFLQQPLFLLISLFMPIIDVTTDWINAGIVIELNFCFSISILKENIHFRSPKASESVFCLTYIADKTGYFSTK